MLVIVMIRLSKKQGQLLSFTKYTQNHDLQLKTVKMLRPTIIISASNCYDAILYHKVYTQKTK